MGRPIWQIRAQNLGTIAENIFFEYELEAIDEDLEPVSYSLIAGTLPEGIQLAGTTISGIPIKITGVPADVDEDTTSQFSIRATSTTNEVSDITLDLTVSGQTTPEITTVAGQLGEFFYGDFVDLQLDAVDQDAGNTLSWSVINNTLPDGLTLTVDPDDDRIAYIRGYPVPATALPPGITPGFDAQDFDEDLGEFGFDFGLETVDKSFEFIISVTDGIGFDSATFSIFLKSRLLFTADNDTITADSTEPTADVSNKIKPNITTEGGDLGDFLHDNYFTFLVEGNDFEGDLINFAVDSGALPSGLMLDATTGYIYGTLDIIPGTSEDYAFDIVCFKVADPEFVSDSVSFTMTVLSDFSNSLVINSPLIMTINNGEISELRIDASVAQADSFIITAANDSITADQSFPTADNSSKEADAALKADSSTVTADSVAYTADVDDVLVAQPVTLQYALVPDSGALPAGLALTTDGLIIGRPSFTHLQWDLDEGETIFDEGETTFDGASSFDVRITDVTLGVIDEVIRFTIIVHPLNPVPYENLYLVAGPTVEEREVYANLINDTTIVPRANLYREQDEYFGVQRDLRFLLADGLNVGTRTQYSSILEKNHHTRRFSFSELKIAKAVDSDGNSSYEVIYADIVDSFENNGESVGEELIVEGVDESDLTNRVPPATPQYDSQGNIIIRPASIDNMRNAIISGGTEGTSGYSLTADNDDQDAHSADMTTVTADATEVAGLGQLNLNTLPDWMTTTQDDGRVFGWIPAVPLIYCKPGLASQVLFNINSSGFNINEISFDVDRYVWDNSLTKLPVDYSLTVDDDETSFDGMEPNGEFSGGVDHEVGDIILMENDAEILVDAVDSFGGVTEFTINVSGDPIGSNATLVQDDGLPDTLIPYSLMGYLNDGATENEEGEVFAFEVTTAGTFRIAATIIDPYVTDDSDCVMSVYDQAGVDIAPNAGFVYSNGTTLDNTFGDGTEVAEYTLTTGIYQILVQAYDIDAEVGPTNVLVAPADGIGMIGGPAGTPTAVHSGVRYVGKIDHNDDSEDISGEVAALATLPDLETDLQNRHSAAAWIDGTINDGHVWQFEVSDPGDFVFGIASGWVDPYEEGPARADGVDIAMSVYDSTGALEFTVNDFNGEYAEKATETLAAGIYQIHVHHAQTGAGSSTPGDGSPGTPPFAVNGSTPGNAISVWITDETEGLRRSPASGDNFASGNLSSGLVYVGQLNGDETPGPIDVGGTGFTMVPVRPEDDPYTNDEYLKFPKTNVFQ